MNNVEKCRTVAIAPRVICSHPCALRQTIVAIVRSQHIGYMQVMRFVEPKFDHEDKFWLWGDCTSYPLEELQHEGIIGTTIRDNEQFAVVDQLFLNKSIIDES